MNRDPVPAEPEPDPILRRVPIYIRVGDQAEQAIADMYFDGEGEALDVPALLRQVADELEADHD